MLRARRLLGWFLAAVAACFVIALLAVNLYVQSQGTQIRIQQELSQRLGMPLRIGRISVTPWGGLRLSAITIPQSNPGAPTPFLEAESIRMRVPIRSIFRRPLVMKEVSLVKPRVVWAQNKAGKWGVPARAAEHPEPSAKIVNVPAPTSVPAAPSSPSTKPTVALEREPSLPQPEIKRVRLVDGSFHFLDRQQRHVALFDGISFSSSVRENNSLQGETRVAHIALRDHFFLSGLRADLLYEPALLKLSRIQAAAAKGQLDGDFSMQPQVEGSPFSVQANFRRVQAEELVAQAGGPRQTVRGVLEGTLTASGKLANPDAVSGSGTIVLHGGHVQQFALLAAIGQLLQIEELMQLDLEQAEATYRLGGGAVTIDQMSLRSPNLRLNAKGNINFNGKVALDATLTINDKIRGQLFRGMRENFVATGEPGQYTLPFHIGGTLEKPKTDLMERAVGTDLKNIGGVIDAIFGRGKSRKKNTPAPTLTPTPAPVFDTNASTPTPVPTP